MQPDADGSELLSDGGTRKAYDRKINTDLAQKGNLVKIRSAFFVYKVFKPSHF
jgi:hypothetical protein